MVPERALFQIEDFFIINFIYNFIDAGPQKDLRVKEIMDAYQIDLDFAFVEKLEDKKVLLYCKTSVNMGEKKLPGYSIFAEGVAIYPFDLGRELSTGRYANEIQIPAISQIINQIRNYILNTTSQGPFGKYQYPLLDLGQIVKTKIGQLRLIREAQKKRNQEDQELLPKRKNVTLPSEEEVKKMNEGFGD